MGLMSVDSISAIKNKPTDYSIKGSKNYLIDIEEKGGHSELDIIESYSDAENKGSKLPSMDTLASALPPSEPLEESTEQVDLKKPKLFSFDTMIDLGKKVWGWISSFFTTQKEAAPVTGSVTDDGVQGVSGTPSLQTPAVISNEAFEKMLQDLKEYSHRIEESGNEAKDQNVQDEKRYIEYFKVQYELRKDGILNIQFQFVFNQQKERAIRKEQSDLKTQNIELQKKRKFWSAVNTGLTIATVAAVVAGLAISAIASAGATIPAAIVAAPGIISVTAGVLNGGSIIVNATLDYQHGKFTGKIEKMDFKQKTINELVRNDAYLTQAEFNKAMENFVSLKQMLDNMYKTQRVITSR